MRTTYYYRIVRRGGALISRRRGFTSSGEQLPRGYVFAFSSPGQVEAAIGGWADWRRVARSSDLVKFTGIEEYDPGDYEGIAVIPVREINRWRLDTWLRTRGLDL